MRLPILYALTAALSVASTVKLMTADDVIARAAAARGGAEKIAAVHTLRMTTRLELKADTTAPLVVEMQRPLHIREELALPDGTLVTTFDGKAGWQLEPAAKEARALGANDLRNLANEADFDGPLSGAKAKGMKVELVGHEMVCNRDAWHLRVTLANGDVQSFFYDAETNLEVKWIGGRRDADGNVTLFESLFSDFRTVDGLQFPFVVESGVVGSHQKQRLGFEKIEVDPPLAADRFAKPAAAPASR